MRIVLNCAGGEPTEQVGIYAVPVIIAFTVLYGAIKRVNVFDGFCSGVREGFGSLVSVAPSLIGLIVGVTMLSASGFFDMVTAALSPVLGAVGFPPEVVPLGLMRPVTGSGSYAVLNGILENYGADSETGKIASVMAGSTETTFYAIAVYYGSIGLKKTRHTIPAALAADMTGMIAAALFVKWFG